MYNFTHVPKPTCANTLNTRIFYVKLRQLATAPSRPSRKIFLSSRHKTGKFRKTIKGKDY